MKQITAIIRLTKACNMACTYCYAGNEEITKTTHIDATNIINYLVKIYNHTKSMTHIILHGGEPLIVGKAFFYEFFESLKKHKLKYKISIQTNASLIDQEFIEIFKKNSVNIGISLDGPCEINDKFRLLKNGKGSYQIIFDNILKLKENNIKFGALVTLSKETLISIDEIYNFFKKNKIPFEIRPIFGTKNVKTKNLFINPDEYAEAYIKFFDKWFYDTDKDIRIGEFNRYIEYFLDPKKGLVACTFMENCNERFICVDIAGDVYPCSRLHGETDFLLGNLEYDSFDQIIKTSQKLRNRHNNITDKCKKCDIFNFCNGGCPSNAFFYNGDYFREDYFCEAYKKIFNHFKIKFESEINKNTD